MAADVAADVKAIVEALRMERRAHCRPDEWIEVLHRVTRRGGDGWNGVSWSDLDEDVADELIQAQIDTFRKRGLSFEWKVYASDRPAGLIERLYRRGFTVGPREAVMVYDTAGGMEGWRASDEIRVERATDERGVADYRTVVEAVFGQDFSCTTASLLAALRQGSTGHLAFVAYEGDQPVSASRLYTDRFSAFGGLYGGGTLATHRGRGLYRAVVRARAEAATALGARYLLVDAMPTSRPILQRLGFVHADDTWPCEWCPGDAA